MSYKIVYYGLFLKCRWCGKVYYPDKIVSKYHDQEVNLMADIIKKNNLLGVHKCDNKRVGVADVVGIREVEG